MQGTGLDEGEVSDQVAQLGHVFDPTDEVGVGRVILVYDRGASPGRLRDQDVHVVAVHRPPVGGAPAQQGLHRLLTVGGRQEVLGVVDHVPFDLGEVFEHGRHVGPVRTQLIDQMAGRRCRDETVELAQLLALAPGLARQSDQRLLELTLERGHLVLDALLLGGRELLEGVRFHHLAALQRREADTRGRPQHGHAALPRALLYRLESALALLGEARLDQLAPRAVVLAVEESGDRRPQLADQLTQVLAQRRATPRREPQRPRPARVREVVHVAPVGRRGLARGATLEERAHEAVLAHPGRAQSEEVVAVAAGADREADGLLRPLLPDDPGYLLELGRGLECEPGWIAPAPEARSGKWPGFAHAVLPPKGPILS